MHPQGIIIPLLAGGKHTLIQLSSADCADDWGIVKKPFDSHCFTEMCNILDYNPSVSAAFGGEATSLYTREASLKALPFPTFSTR